MSKPPLRPTDAPDRGAPRSDGLRGRSRLLRRGLRGAAFAAATLAALAQPAYAAGFVRDAEVEATLKRLSDPLFRAAGVAPDSIEIRIFDDRQPNAFVYGGRNLVVSTGLLRDFSEPTQLQGVIAHEIGHITGGHLARRQIAMNNLRGPAMAGVLLGIAAAAAAGLAGGAGGAAAGVGLGASSQTAVRRAMLSFSRAEESAADQAGITYLERAGVDPTGMEQVLEKFRGQEVFSTRHVDPYALTHPVSAERLSSIQRRASESPARGREPDAELLYWTHRMEAKLEGFLETPWTVLRRLDPNDHSEFTTLRRAVALHRAPDPEGAVAEANRLIEIRPNDPYYYELKGQILLESGRGVEAVAPYRRAVALAPEEPLILGYLGRALLSVGSPEADREALSALERGAERSDGGDPGLLRDLAFAYARTGDEGRAALVTAERMMLINQPRDAHRMAERAKGMLPHGSPAWLRADDIVVATKAMEQ
ncbi:M48 family metalloprotease [Albimonas sp. CAU 1670]|uniref:M48 family metalloprotease n=1 Tax=Albimonas sp. CAU 1670 TaxID=3032599 RepID=UPI0023DACC66|nr:M48 family metalloprotease [Albimonas sp. CAU 1670]MDF2232534.1 M48 family metalloprotease [Albimonas sp. CAU 1670]